jgi:hypothetical protein
VSIYLGNEIFLHVYKRRKILLFVIFSENKPSVNYEQRGRVKKQKTIKNSVNFVHQFHCKGNVLGEKMNDILGTLEFREAHFDYRCSRLCKFRITAKLLNH